MRLHLFCRRNNDSEGAKEGHAGAWPVWSVTLCRISDATKGAIVQVLRTLSFNVPANIPRCSEVEVTCDMRA